MSTKKLSGKLAKFVSLLNGVFSSISSGYDKHGIPKVILKSKSFNLGRERNFKLYCYGTLDYNANDLIKYSTYVVLTQKKLSDDKEKIIHSFHFDGNINENQSDHPIFHMQFDNSIMEKIEPEKFQDDFFEVETGENKRFRIPTPQLDIVTFIYLYLKAIDTESMKKVKFDYLDRALSDFNINTINNGYSNGIAQVIFP